MSECFETRYEWLRPGELRERQKDCALVILPVAPLEYHGPHMPLGTDPVNATRIAHACCEKLGKGVVMPTLYAGTERERDEQCLKALGFEKDEYVVGMDFPTRLWNSHYLPEEVFAAIVSANIDILIRQGYKYIFICNGHGAVNHIETTRRLCIQYSNTTDAKLDSMLSLDKDWAGHGDMLETSLIMYYNRQSVDLDTLPSREVPIRYTDFSIVDGIGFTQGHDPEHIIRKTDPRDATVDKGRESFEKMVGQMATAVKKLISNND